MNTKPANNLVLAVDGGQTHSVALIADLQGHVLAAGKGGPANHFLEPGGPERFTQSMNQCIQSALSKSHPNVRAFEASHYCLTGVHAAMLDILQEIAPSSKQVVAGDKEASLTGGTLERPAVLVLAGTGSIAFGMTADGKQTTVGGWGYVMGDEGSASWIAPRGLSAATRADDGRGAATILSTLIPQRFGVDTLRELHPLIYHQQIDRVRLAEVASVVGHAAMLGDVVALEIISEAAEYLGGAALAVIRQLGLAHQSISITSAGGVFKAGALLIDPMMAHIQRGAPLAQYHAPRFPPVIGAVMLALQSIKVVIDEPVLSNLATSACIWRDLK